MPPSSALSDDGRTPLIVAPGGISAARMRRQKLLALGRVVLGFVLSAWYKLLILGVIITLIVLVSIKVRSNGSSMTMETDAVGLLALQALIPRHTQGFGIFGDILAWFKNHNGWAGWGAFLGEAHCLLLPRCRLCTTAATCHFLITLPTCYDPPTFPPACQACTRAWLHSSCPAWYSSWVLASFSASGVACWRCACHATAGVGVLAALAAHRRRRACRSASPRRRLGPPAAAAAAP